MEKRLLFEHLDLSHWGETLADINQNTLECCTVWQEVVSLHPQAAVFPVLLKFFFTSNPEDVPERNAPPKGQSPRAACTRESDTESTNWYHSLWPVAFASVKLPPTPCCCRQCHRSDCEQMRSFGGGQGVFLHSHVCQPVFHLHPPCPVALLPAVHLF